MTCIGLLGEDVTAIRMTIWKDDHLRAGVLRDWSDTQIEPEATLLDFTVVEDPVEYPVEPL